MFQNHVYGRIRSERGIARLTFILIVIAAVLAAFVLGIPIYRFFTERSAAYGCGAALATANDQLKIYYLAVHDTPTEEEAKEEVTRAMDGWDDLCPGGGDCYIVESEEEGVLYKVVCALHDSDAKEASFLNAKSALEQIQAMQDTDGSSDELAVTLNSEEFAVTEDSSETTIQTSRKSLRKAGGAMISCHIEDGTVTWLCYADKTYTYIWDIDKVGSIRNSDGWTVRFS